MFGPRKTLLEMILRSGAGIGATLSVTNAPHKSLCERRLALRVPREQRQSTGSACCDPATPRRVRLERSVGRGEESRRPGSAGVATQIYVAASPEQVWAETVAS
jgi:hypothetical protein